MIILCFLLLSDMSRFSIRGFVNSCLKCWTVVRLPATSPVANEECLQQHTLVQTVLSLCTRRCEERRQYREGDHLGTSMAALLHSFIFPIQGPRPFWFFGRPRSFPSAGVFSHSPLSTRSMFYKGQAIRDSPVRD